MNLEFKIPDIHSFNKHLLSKFIVPGTLQHVLGNAVSALTPVPVSVRKSVNLPNGYIPIELCLLSFHLFTKDVPGTEDAAVNKIDDSPCGTEV